jgi:hypothetical protein
MEKTKVKCKKLTSLVQNLENKFELFEHSNPTVSANSIGWHIDHSFRVIIEIVKYVEKSNPSDYKSTFNLKRSIVYFTGKIPRGKGKAPQQVLPPDIISLADLQNEVILVRSALKSLDIFEKNKYFKHPLFGLLNIKQTVKFLEIHTFHHIKIINDIR